MKIVDIRVRPKMVVRIKDNCGNGAGGFQAGNDCAAGDGDSKKPKRSQAASNAESKIKERFRSDSDNYSNVKPASTDRETSRAKMDKLYPEIMPDIGDGDIVQLDTRGMSASDIVENMNEGGLATTARETSKQSGNSAYFFNMGGVQYGAIDAPPYANFERVIVFTDKRPPPKQAVNKPGRPDLPRRLQEQLRREGTMPGEG